MKTITCTLAAVAALASTMAQAAQPVCLSEDEATSLIAYALPQAISGTAKRCAASLPADAYLRRHGGELAARYAGQKDRYWPRAKPVFLKTLASGGNDMGQMVQSLPDETMRQMADAFVEGAVSQRIALKSCDKLDLAIDMLSPLPPENTAALIALSLQLASEAQPRLGNVALCKN